MTRAAPQLRRTVAWVPGTLVAEASGVITVTHPGGRVALPASAEVRRAVDALLAGTEDDDGVADAWCAGDDVQPMIDAYGFLAWLRTARLVDDVFRQPSGGAPVVAVNGASGYAVYPVPRTLALSPHAYARPGTEGPTLAEPVSGGIARILDAVALSRVPLVQDLARGRAVDGALAAADPTGLLPCLLSAGLLVDPEAAGPDGLDTWEFHDLLMHQRSRIGRHAEPIGATFPFAGSRDPAPSHVDVKFPGAPSIPLPVPAPGPGPGLFDVLERRTSVRRSPREIDLARLGALLHQSARITAYHPRTADPRSYPATRRPYPTGGAAYDLEIYPVVRRCADLDAGIYYYNPAHHALETVSIDRGPVEQLATLATAATAGLAEVQVLLVITSRFARLSWKYRSISYATTLKNVGALYQTLYLVATALDLAPCALGTGSPMVFAEATGLPLHEESSVGEFLLSG